MFRQSEAADSAQWTGLVPQGPYRRDDALPGTPRRRSRALTAPLHPQPAWHLGRWRLTSCSSSYKASLRTPNAFSLAKAYETGERTLSKLHVLLPHHPQLCPRDPGGKKTSPLCKPASMPAPAESGAGGWAPGARCQNRARLAVSSSPSAWGDHKGRETLLRFLTGHQHQRLACDKP